jgi:hypothetical protein
MRPNTGQIKFDQWFKEFKPLLDGEMEAKLVDLNYATKFDSRQVWTLLDDNNKSIIVNGFRNNALGYFVTSERFHSTATDLVVLC